VTGFGAIEKGKGGLIELIRGEIRLAWQSPLSSRLITIYDQLLEVIDRVSPDAIAIEDIFYGKNVKSLIKQAHVRGVSIMAGSRRGVPVFEYTPLEVKQAVVGYGRAEKDQVQKMVKAILSLSELPQADEADALAVAICHINFLKLQPI
jgi:crossover junction endodeoxyribonuclease RuvC